MFSLVSQSHRTRTLLPQFNCKTQKTNTTPQKGSQYPSQKSSKTHKSTHQIAQIFYEFWELGFPDEHDE